MNTDANAQTETLLPRAVLAQQPRVGDVVRVTFQAPAIGYIDYRVTRIDALGIYGLMVRNTVREIYPW
jgi:hypothetical protein